MSKQRHRPKVSKAAKDLGSRKTSKSAKSRAAKLLAGHKQSQHS